MSKKACFNLGLILTCLMSCAGFASELNLLPAEVTITNRMGQSQTHVLTLSLGANAAGVCSGSFVTYEKSRQLIDAKSRRSVAKVSQSQGERLFSLPPGVEFVDAEVLMRFQSIDPIEQLQVLAAIGGGEIVRRYSLVPGLALVKMPQAVTSNPRLEDFVRQLNSAKGVRYAHPNYVQKAFRVPNDPKFSSLWGMSNRGQTGGRSGADIDAPTAWNVSVGSSEIIVGVIDTGVDYEHEDLALNMWTNPGEIPGDGIDNDGNGYVDDVYGINAIRGNGDPMDDNEHGTHCAGTIAAVGGNGIGVAGVCWKARIMALKFLNASGSGATADAMTCMEYAVQNGARVLSNSWGGGGYDASMRDMIDAAGAKGVVFVAAAGNDGTNNDAKPQYPCNYECDNIISVMATDCNDGVASFSNFGVETVHIGAPGVDIYSCAPGDGYQFLSGTSMATPHVSGAAALLLSVNKGLSPLEVRKTLMESGDPVLKGECISGCRLNVGRAIGQAGKWLEVDSERYERLVPGMPTKVCLRVDAGYNAPGTYEGMVSALNDGKTDPEASTAVTMVVLPDDLEITPADPRSVTGPETGPFSPGELTFDLYNSDREELMWEVSSDSDWISFATTSGSLEGGGRGSFAVRINDNSRYLAPGLHSAAIIVHNCRSGAFQRRTITLTVTAHPGILYVDAEHGDDAAQGRYWETAKKTIQAAISRAVKGDSIVVNDGFYPSIQAIDKKISISSVNGPEKTFIIGRDGRCATFGEYYAMHRGGISTKAFLSGFTLMDGWAGGSDYYGGGVLGGLISNCVIRSCSAQYGGGACLSVLKDCILYGNSAMSYGGAAYESELEGCRIERNVAAYGGGVREGVLTRCRIQGNTARSYGGGAYEAALRGCLVYGNTSGYYGGGVCKGTASGCTIVYNRVASYGGGAYQASLINCVVAYNERTDGMCQNCEDGTATYSCVMNPSSGTKSPVLLGDGCFSDDPGLFDVEHGVCCLRSGSLCLNAGTNTADMVSEDLDGNARVKDGRVDIGAFEGAAAGVPMSVEAVGVGMVDRTSFLAVGGSAETFRALDMGRPFLYFATNGVFATSEKVFTWSDIQNTGRVSAVFGTCELYADASRPDDLGDGLTWKTAKRTLSAAIRAAQSNETVYVARGSYEPVVSDGRAVTLQSEEGPTATFINGGETNKCADLGGSSSLTTLRGFTLINGYTKYSGGGADGGILSHCVIRECRAESNGGGAYSATLNDCLVCCNVGGTGGGSSFGTMRGCTVIGNVAKEEDGVGGTYSTSAYNCVMLGNRNGTTEESNYSGWRFDHCCSIPCPQGAGNVLGSVQTVVDAYNGDGRPRKGSELVDAGSTEFVQGSEDLPGNTRIQGQSVDIGCYEGDEVEGCVLSLRIKGNGDAAPRTAVVPPGESATFTAFESGRKFEMFMTNGVMATAARSFTWEDVREDGIVTAIFKEQEYHVRQGSEVKDPDGLSWESSFARIQDAVDHMAAGETVWVDDGVYEPIVCNNKRIVIRSVHGPAKTIIDGGHTNRCATLGENDECDTVLAGFTLRNGQASSGGGSYCGTLTNCWIVGNLATNRWAGADGGGCYRGILLDCLLSNNTAAVSTLAYGGAAYYATLHRCRVVDNRAIVAADDSKVEGGGAWLSTAYDTLFYGNKAIGKEAVGGGVSSTTLYGCTVVGNFASGPSASAGVSGSYAYNSIIWGNKNGAGDLANCDSVNLRYSCCQAVSKEDGNISDDPLFRNVLRGDFRLSEESPCIDAGSVSYVKTVYDLLLKPRVTGERPDMGACEWRPVTDTPVIIPEDGTVFEGLSQKVRIICDMDDAVIRYTTDGTVPDESSAVYSRAFNIKDTTLVSARAYRHGLQPSDLAVAFICRKSYLPREDLAEALNVSETVESGGGASWTVDSQVSHDGVSSARSGAIADSQSSWMETRVTGTGTLKFWWKTSCEDDVDYDDWDYVRVWVDGVERLRRDGQGDWHEAEIRLEGDSAHVVRWEYVKDGSESEGEDCVWVDQLKWMRDGQETRTTEVPVPYEWLRRMGVAEDADYEKAAQAIGANGVPYWQSYVAGLVPTNEQSKFVVKIEVRDGSPIVTWSPDLRFSSTPRSYHVYGSEEIAPFEWVDVTENLDLERMPYRFFKVHVDMQ